jgi:DNA-directed RNA polymerase II subunit RPB2
MASALEDPSWNLIRSYFEEKGMVRSQITSYNELIYKVIPDVITRHGVLAFEHSGNSYKYSLRNPYFGLPSFVESEGDRRYITPNECRLRNLTYQAPLFCDVVASTKTKLGASKTMTEKIMLCHIPVMLKSELCVLRNRTEHEMTELGECMYDHGGYFIINGSEKVLIAQERTAFNQVCCYQDKAGNYLAELRSVPEGVSRAATQVSVILENNKDASKHVPSSLINIKMHYLKDRTVPFVVIFRALGIIDEDEIIRFITVDNDPDIVQLLKPTFEACKVITDSLTACKYIGHCSPYMNASLEQQLNHVQNIILIREFMPHIGSEEKDARSKAYLLGHMIYKCLMTYLGRRDFDDRDHVGNKRLELSGNLLGSTFRIHFSRLIKETTLLLEKKIKASKTISFTSDFDFKSINKMMCSNLSTGNWGTNSGNKGNRTGVTQSLHRLTYAATLSCLRRQVAPIAKEGKSAKPRQLHNSSYGRNCSAETPEGQSCGLIKNLSMLCEISTESSSTSIRELLSMEDLTPALELQSGAKVFVNGCCMGTTDDPVDIFKKLKEWKLTRLIPSETSIVWNEFENEVNVMTDGGRCLRPLLYIHGRQCEEFVEDLKCAMVANKRWSDLCKLQLVEYLDCREEEHIMCAMRYEDWKHNEFELDYTHLEIHPSMIIGVACSTIPFANTNPAPRLSYQSSQLKQALGIYAMNYQTRFDTQSHVMWYPQKPLLNTKMGDILKVTDMPAGQQCMVAIAVYGG